MILALITVCALMALGALLFVVWPQISSTEIIPSIPAFFFELKHLHSERLRFLANLQDLELDRSMSKISDDDYALLRSSLMTELSRIYQEIEALEKRENILIQIELDSSSRRLP